MQNFQRRKRSARLGRGRAYAQMAYISRARARVRRRMVGAGARGPARAHHRAAEGRNATHLKRFWDSGADAEYGSDFALRTTGCCHARGLRPTAAVVRARTKARRRADAVRNALCLKRAIRRTFEARFG